MPYISRIWLDHAGQLDVNAKEQAVRIRQPFPK